MTTPLLLLHGQPGGARDWSRLTAALGDRAAALVIDRPGWEGRSEATGLAGNAEAAVAALDAAGIERATIVGHSFGGGVAAWIGAAYPDRVSRLVLAAPAANCASLTRLDRLLAVAAIGSLTSTAMLLAAGAGLELASLRRSLDGTSPLEKSYLRDVAGMLAKPHVWRAFAVEQKALVSELPTLERQLHRIAAPTTIVAGTADRVVPREATRKLVTQIPGSELVLLRRAGHLLPHLHAQELAAIILGSAPANAAPSGEGAGVQVG